MTLPTDMSIMDFLFDRDDPIISMSDKDSMFKNEDTWPSNPDEFLDSLLKLEDHPFEILDDSDMFTIPDAICTSVPNSSCSDSGLSSDQQFSPMVQDADDEDGGDMLLSTSSSEGSPNPACYSIDSVCSTIKEEEIEIDSSVYDLSDTETLGDIMVDDNQAIIDDFDSTTSNETITLHTIQNNSVHKLIRVTPISGNPRSILLPVSLKDMKDIRAIKVMNSGMTRKFNTNSTLKSISKGSTIGSSKHISSDEESDESHYPRLQLTGEEKRLLQKEGVRLPSHFPLTKYEERELKRIRRKIRNKISAQDSRKRKKEYIDGLEDRVKQCTEENMSLVKKIKVLQSQNQTMMTQLKRLHAALSRGTAKTAQPATCLMVLMLSMALVMMPNLGTNQPTDVQAETEITLPENEIPPIAGRSRTLLFTKPSTLEEGLCLPSEEQMKIEEIQISSLVDTPRYNTKVKSEEQRMMAEMNELLHFKRNHDDHDYGPGSAKKMRKESPEYLEGSDGFIIPPLDDDWPPPNPYTADKTNDITNRIGDYANEFKINISDTRGTRTVVLQVPTEK